MGRKLAVGVEGGVGGHGSESGSGCNRAFLTMFSHPALRKQPHMFKAGA